jgi:hypothetical protein
MKMKCVKKEKGDNGYIRSLPRLAALRMPLWPW